MSVKKRVQALELPDKKATSYLPEFQAFRDLSKTMSHSSLSPADFKAAREAMVASQLYTSGVVDEAVLEAYRYVPRELFVPPERQGVCYLDDDVQLANGRSLLEPLVHALMVEHAAIQVTDRVLDIGGLTGYSAAILTRLGKFVVALEEDALAMEVAQANWQQLQIENVMPVCAPMAVGNSGYAPYDVILINGAVSALPPVLLDQLNTGGRLVCVERPEGSLTGQIRLYTRQGAAIGSTVIADASVPYLQGFGPVQKFVF